MRLSRKQVIKYLQRHRRYYDINDKQYIDNCILTLKEKDLLK